MNRYVIPSLLAVSLILAAGLTGCDGDDDKADPVGADLDGQWSGVYYVEGGGRISITASISQDGDSIKLSTSKPTPPGQHLTGRIDADRMLDLNDQFDGEEWTSLEPVTANRVRIGDFVRQPTARDRIEGNDVAMKVIHLER